MMRALILTILFVIAVRFTDNTYIKENRKSDENFRTLFAAENAISFAEIVNSLPTPTLMPEEIVKQEETRVSSFNIKSGKDNGELPANAVTNSPALVTATPTVSTPTLGPTNTPSPTITEPTITFIPLPTEFPDPKRCAEMLCPMIACIDNTPNQERPEVIYEDCRCPCVPPPIREEQM